MTERMIETGGVELCTESFGARDDPPILLIAGLGSSMLWWEEGFCRLLAQGERFVLRYDHRDTGRSTSYLPGKPPYRGEDLLADPVRILDAYGIDSAHVVGVSAGAAFAQLLALDLPGRVRSLVLISTTLALPGETQLPPPSEAFTRFVSTAKVDWSSTDSVEEYLLAYVRLLAGPVRPFDETAARRLIRAELERARSFASRQNHDLLAPGEGEHPPLDTIAAPTLVVHGSADPMFPIEHGEALAAEIPGARLLRLEGAGHGVDRADWERLAAAILDHTAAPTDSA